MIVLENFAKLKIPIGLWKQQYKINHEINNHTLYKLGLIGKQNPVNINGIK